MNVGPQTISRVRRLATLLRAGLLMASLWPASAALGATSLDAIDMRIAHPPQLVAVEGHCRLTYEVHLTNFAAVPHTLAALTINADDDEVARLDAAALRASTRILGAAADADAVLLQAGATAIVYVDHMLPRDCETSAPKQLVHALTVDGADAPIVGARTPVQRAPTAFGPPLRGGAWVAIHAPHWPRGHRRVFYTLDGRARLPGRFAIDFVRVDDAGRIARDDADIAANSLGHGAAVLAVADARVAATRDGMQEPELVSNGARNEPDDAAGNYIALELPDGRHVLYEHLRPQSVRVRPGDTVKRGQHIADLGFTGDSTGPHLHLHVADAASPLRGEGLPFAFDRFELLGHYADLGKLGQERWQPGTITAGRSGEFPASNAVIHFAD